MNKNKGFTLIELLVVVAIIVILAMIVFPGVRTATQKARDARIISEMSQIRTQAEIFYNSQTPNTYAGMYGTGTDIEKLLTDIDQQNGDSYAAVSIAADSDSYCATVQLAGGQYFCIDSQSTTVQGAAAYDCGTDAAVGDCTP